MCLNECGIYCPRALGQAGSYMKAINIYHKSNKAFMATRIALLEMPFFRPPQGNEEMEKAFFFAFN